MPRGVGTLMPVQRRKRKKALEVLLRTDLKPLIVAEFRPWDLAVWDQRRLREDVLRMRPKRFAEEFDWAGLLKRHPWQVEKARRAALRLSITHAGGRLVLLGPRVAEAFGVDPEPFKLHEDPASACTLVTLPHPDPRSEAWRRRGSKVKARGIMLQIGVWL